MANGIDIRVRFPVDDAAVSALHTRAFRSTTNEIRPWAARLSRHSLTGVRPTGAGLLRLSGETEPSG